MLKIVGVVIFAFLCIGLIETTDDTSWGISHPGILVWEIIVDCALAGLFIRYWPWKKRE